MVVVTRPYVVLHHTGYGEAHFDLMLAVDDDGPLFTWRLTDWPPTQASGVSPLPPHRRVYLAYEGEVSDNRGQVRRVQAGNYDCAEHQKVDGVLTVDIAGHALRLPLR